MYRCCHSSKLLLHLLLHHATFIIVEQVHLSCLLQADLTDLTSLPATLVGISAIIDCATARPEESTQKIDWEGKVGLIQCAQVSVVKPDACSSPIHTDGTLSIASQRAVGAGDAQGERCCWFHSYSFRLFFHCVFLVFKKCTELSYCRLSSVLRVHCVSLQAMGIKRYIFMSIFNCNKHPEVPLMNIKAATEEYLAASGLGYTVLRLCGFHQVCTKGSSTAAIMHA